MNIIKLLKHAKKNYDSNIAYQYKDESITFSEVYEKTLAVATKISLNSQEKQPIAVISNKNINIPSIYMGIAYSNCYYVPISSEMPKNKIESILQLTEAKIIICDDDNFNLVSSLNYSGKIFKIDECVSQPIIDKTLIDERENNLTDKNPLYVIFTSGSTGVPKGVVTCHAAVVDYLLTFVETFKINKDEIFGNQALICV